MLSAGTALVACTLVALSTSSARGGDDEKEKCVIASNKAQDLRGANKLRGAREQLLQWFFE